jgi:hypothetical protein
VKEKKKRKKGEQNAGYVSLQIPLSIRITWRYFDREITQTFVHDHLRHAKEDDFLHSASTLELPKDGIAPC